MVYKKNQRGKNSVKKATISSSAMSKSKKGSTEVNPVGWKDDDGDSNSSSDLSETWSEIGAKLFSTSNSKDQQNSQQPVVEPGPSSPVGSFNDDNDNRMDDFSNSEDNDDDYFNSCFSTATTSAPQVRPKEIVKIEPEPVNFINENEGYDNDNDDNQNSSDEDYILPDIADNDDDDAMSDDSRESNKNNSQNFSSRRSLRVQSKGSNPKAQESNEASASAEDSDPEFNPCDIDEIKVKKVIRSRQKRSRIGRYQRVKRIRNNPPQEKPQQEPSPFNYSDFQFHCDICDFNYENESYQTDHYQNHLDNLRCIGLSLGCTEIYQNIEDLKEHVLSCSLAFQFRSSALKNINEKPLLCLFLSCERSFGQIRQVLDHMKNFNFHFDEKQVVYGLIPNPKLPCEICYDLLANHRTLKNHIESKHPESQASISALPINYFDFPFACNICDLKYQTQNYLTRHYEYHMDGLRCIGYNFNCSTICSSIEDLREHVNTCLYAIQHKKSVLSKVIDLEKPYHCLIPECGQVYSTPDAVVRHLRGHHGSRERFAEKKKHIKKTERFKCGFKNCSKYFTHESSLLRHKKIHCPQVQKAGTGGGQNHNVICHLCGLGFSREGYLKDHFARMHKEKKHICSYEGCNKGFAVLHLLKRHVKIHEKCQSLPSNNTCVACGAYFPTQLGLYKHMSKFHSEKSDSNYCCETCGGRYTHELHLLRHQKTHSIQLAARKEVYIKNQIRSQNPQISDEEIAVLLLNWDDDRPLTRDHETSEEKLARRRLEMIDKITSKRLQKPGETMDESLVRIKNENQEKLKLKREMETEEERAIRRTRYKLQWASWRERNPEKCKDYYAQYAKKYYAKSDTAAYEKFKSDQRARWANLSPQVKAQRLEKMRNRSKNRSRNNNNN